MAGADDARPPVLRAADHLPERFNLAEWLVHRHVAEGRGGRTALLGDWGETSYAELDERVRRWAAAFREAGVEPGSRVALLGPDGPDLLTGFLAAVAAGGVAVPLNTLFSRDELRYVLRDCRPSLLVHDGELAPPAEAGDTAEAWTLQQARRRASGREPAPGYADTHRDGFAFLLYTSGTTGRPKGVVHLQHDAWISCRTYGDSVLGVGRDDRAFSIAKLFFAYGLGNSGYLPLAAGASSVLFDGRPTPQAVFEQVRRHRPTLFFGVPTAYAKMLSALADGAEADFSSVRLCVSAGEALPPAVYRAWRERTGLEILDGIGTTELCHIFLSNRPGDAVPGSSGVPVEGYDVRLVDEEGDDVPAGEVGDLVVRGDSAMALYWQRHEATKAALHGAWIRTGDKYRHDPEEDVYRYEGRTDDMLKVGGIWVSPAEVEACLMEHDAVRQCAVVGDENDQGLVKPRAYVVADRASDDLARELQAFVKDRLAAHKYPRWVTFVDDLPTTATGKIRRFELREG